eukprot:12417121-Prorocentrum_lima.AAC.1
MVNFECVAKAALAHFLARVTVVWQAVTSKSPAPTIDWLRKMWHKVAEFGLPNTGDHVRGPT